MYKEKKIASFQQDKNRLQLLKITYETAFTPYYKDSDGKLKGGRTFIIKYQVRLNRKIIDTSISEYTMRKLFASYAQNIVLQLKIF